MALEPGTRLGPYEIVSLLGKGGMGEVYRSRDTRLDRTVAIKVLAQSLSEDDRYRRRLEREAKTISQLQHPNVCVLLDVGSEPEAPFYLVMEHLEGETLEDRLGRGPLPLEKALRIGREIAEAMEAAHRRGVVHRDLKPGNVMLTEHGTKVLDFGLAREFEVAGVEADTHSPTVTSPISEEGTISGTFPYMAPEQLEGKPADARTDLWALGCVLYEMTTGSRPFQGDTQASLVGAIMQSQPVPVSQRQPVSPERLDWLVSRCLDKDPERRAQSARDVSVELEAILEGSQSGSATSGANALPAVDSERDHGRPSEGSESRLPRPLLLGAAALAVVAGIWWLGGRGERPAGQRPAGLREDGTIAAVADPLSGLPSSVEDRIALLVGTTGDTILPFENRSSDADLEDFAVAIQERMAAVGGRLGSQMLVLDPGSGFTPVCDLARGRRWIYGGSVHAIQNRVGVNATLTSCPEETLRWSDSWDFSRDDLVAATEAVASTILAESQQVQVLDVGSRGSVRWYLWQFKRESAEEVLSLIAEGIRRDPDSAASYAVGRMETHLQILTEGWGDPPSKHVQALKEIGVSFQQSAPNFFLGHGVVGMAAQWEGDPDAMLSNFRRAVAVGGDVPIVHQWLGAGLYLTGRHDEAIRSLETAIRMSPNDPAMVMFRAVLSHAYFAAGRYEEALREAETAVGLNANTWVNGRAFAYTALAASSAQLGRDEQAEEALRNAVELRPALNSAVAMSSFGAGEPELKDRYLAALRRAGLPE